MWSNLWVSVRNTVVEWWRQTAPLFVVFLAIAWFYCHVLSQWPLLAELFMYQQKLVHLLRVLSEPYKLSLLTSVCMCMFNTVALWENWRAWPLLPTTSVQATYLRELQDCHDTLAGWKYSFVADFHSTASTLVERTHALLQGKFDVVCFSLILHSMQSQCVLVWCFAPLRVVRRSD